MGKYTGAVLCICNLRFNVSNEIFVFFHSGSYCDYHFFMKELASLKIKYKNVSVPIEKEIRKADRNGNEDITTVSYKMKDLWHV